MKMKLIAALIVGSLPMVTNAETNLVISSFGGNGRLSWSNVQDTTQYSVEWASSLNGVWTNSWSMLSAIPATGSVYTVDVPMFYRLVAVTATKLLLHCDGTNGSTNFFDSTGRHDLQTVGNIHVAGAEVRFGTGSASFDGRLNHWLAIPDSSDFDPGQEPFTIDFWMYPTNASVEGQYLMGKSNPDSGRGYDIRYHQQAIRVVGVNGWADNIISPAIVTNGSWYHIAVVCQTNQAYLFINGTNRGTSPRGKISDTIDAFHIGDSPGFGGNAFSGYLDEIRYSLGIARWTNNFAVPTAPYGDN